MRKKNLILVLIFIFLMGLAINLLLTTKKATNISWIASERLSDIDGRVFEINDVSGKRYTILNFWATWCEPCKEEMPSLDKLAVDQNFQNLKILPVNIGQEKTNKIDEFYNKTKIKNLEIFYDTDVRLAKKFLLRGVPTTLIVGKDGKEFARVVGSIDFQDESFKTWLQAFD